MNTRNPFTSQREMLAIRDLEPDDSYQDTQFDNQTSPSEKFPKTENQETEKIISAPLNQGWREISRRWKDSVLQLRVTSASINPVRPYQTPQDRRSSGTGFIIDIEKGLVLTNAHVVKNALSIVARTIRLGSRDIPIKLYSISLERDLAVCQLTSAGINMVSEGIKDQKSLNIKFADDLFTQETDEVLTIGYPLGNEIKFTTGVISGFHREDNGDKHFEDALSRDPTYIQITAAINPGNSGGPLFNREGKVIGINAAGFMFAQNTGYAIRSRIFLSLLPFLLEKEGIVSFPTWSFEWFPTNSAFFQTSSTSEGNGECQRKLSPKLDQREKTKESPKEQNLPNGGIFIRKIYQDSVLSNQNQTEGLEGRRIGTVKGLKIGPSFDLAGSVLVSIIYYDPFLVDLDIFDPLKYQSDSNSSNQSETREANTLAEVDHHGLFTLYRLNDGTKITDRLLDLSEMIDLLPAPSDLILQLYHRQERPKGSSPTTDEVTSRKPYHRQNITKLDSTADDVSPQKKESNNIDKKCPYSLVNINYVVKSSDRLEKAQPIIKPFDYEILGGMCIMELMDDHSELNLSLNCRNMKIQNRYKPALIVCQVFPATEASRVGSISQYNLLKTFAGQEVTNLSELRALISKMSEEKFLKFSNSKGFELVIEKEMALEEDAQILEMFKILPKYNSLSSGDSRETGKGKSKIKLAEDAKIDLSG